MASLIKSILDLPKINLTKEEWAALRNIKKNFDLNIKGHRGLCLKAFACKPFNDKPEVQYFIAQWISLAETINRWFTQLRSIWDEVIHKPLGADDLLPLVIDLLPNNQSILASMIERLEIANEVDYSSGFAYSINTILMAATYKLGCLRNEEPIVNDKRLNDKITQVVEHISDSENKRYLHKIELLRLACEFYLNQSIEKIISITGKDNTLFKDQSPQQQYQTLIELNCADEAFITLKSNEHFQKLINNFTVITGMYLTLANKKRPPAKRLQSFIHQLADQVIELDNNPDADMDRLLEELHLLLKLPRAHQKTSFATSIRRSMPSLPSLSLPSLSLFKRKEKPLTKEEGKQDADDGIKEEQAEESKQKDSIIVIKPNRS